MKSCLLYTSSIKERGVITPATVRQKEDGRYELVSGHRRKRACELMCIRDRVYVARDNIGEDSYADFKKSDNGDIYGVKGFAFRTKTGEISIHAEEITLLSKSLQILPEKFHGLTDTVASRVEYLG